MVDDDSHKQSILGRQLFRTIVNMVFFLAMLPVLNNAKTWNTFVPLLLLYMGCWVGANFGISKLWLRWYPESAEYEKLAGEARLGGYELMSPDVAWKRGTMGVKVRFKPRARRFYSYRWALPHEPKVGDKALVWASGEEKIVEIMEVLPLREAASGSGYLARELAAIDTEIDSADTEDTTAGSYEI